MASPTQEQSQQQTQRIMQSAAFRNAHTLQHLLQFLVARAYRPDAETLKEYTVGVEAFGKPQDFDPKTDTIVRVHVHRLRQKLKEYYDSDGRFDPILIEIPRGHYLPTFEAVAAHNHLFVPGLTYQLEQDGANAASGNGHDPGSGGRETGGKHSRFRRLLSARATVAAVASVAIFAAGFWIGIKWIAFRAGGDALSARSALSFEQSADPVKAFWANFLGNDTSPIMAHSDAVFLLDSNNDLFSFPHGASDYRGSPVDPELARKFAANPALVAKAGSLYYEDAYTGTGDLDAVGILANLLGQMGVKPVIAAGKELTPEDLKQHNVFLFGSSFQNYAVAQFLTMGDFTFVNPEPLGEWRGTIVNAHPRPGEASVYRTERDPVTQVVKVDHALITIEPGIVPGRYIADFGGLDTMGSEGAAMFATSKSGVEQLSKALAVQGIHGTNGGPPFFQALLSVRIQEGDEVLDASLVTVHPLSLAPKSTPVEATPQTSTH